MYLSLFLTTFLSATIIPFSSEFMFTTAIYLGYSPFLCIVAAGSASCLGGGFNYLLGRTGVSWAIQKLFKFDRARLEQFKARHRQYGIWFLLASWMPLIGDPITLYAGIVKVPLGKFSLIVCSTRVGRYVALYYLLKIIGVFP